MRRYRPFVSVCASMAFALFVSVVGCQSPRTDESTSASRGAVARGAAAAAESAARPTLPETPRDGIVDTIHGVEVPDPYRWLEDRDSPEVKAWVDAQNAYTRAMLDAPAWRATLTDQVRRYYDVTINGAPSVHGRRYFSYRREGLKNHAILYVRDGDWKAEPKLLLDPNTFSETGTVALDWMYPSPDGSMIAYGKSAAGSEMSTLYLRETATGREPPESIPYTRFGSVAWEPDGRGFYYTRYPVPGTVAAGDENYYRKVFYHRLGTQWEGDPCIYGEGRPKEEINSVGSSSDHRYLFVSRQTIWTKNDLFFKDMQSGAPLTTLCEGLEAQTGADVWDGMMYLLTSLDAPRYRVCKTPVDEPNPANWKEIVPQQDGVIQRMAIIDGKLVLTILEKVCSRIMVYSTEGEFLDEIELPTLGSVSGVNGDPREPNVFFSFESFAYPPTVFRYDLREKKLEILDQLNLGKDLSAYETKQVWYSSRDGTQVPMFIVHKKGLPLNGANPTLLYGYGGFNISLTPSFRASRYVWLDRGGVYAVPNIRGGGEFGQDWHHGGRLGNKQNVFDDFIAAGEWLVANGYTQPSKLAIMGGSNGGLLTGAVTVQRPDLFGAVVCAVPLLDMIRYPNFQIARLWMQEYGDPEKPDEFAWLLKYSPYHNVRPGTKYPAILFKTAASDTRVDPIHAWKTAAQIQACNVGERPVLLRTDFDAGHGAGKPLSKRIEEEVDDFVFLMAQTGMSEQ